jgi:hypothetical protein
MRYRKPTHPVTADHRREIDIGSLARHGAFRQPMRFPFQGIESARDHIRLFSPGNRQRPPQIIAVQWRQMTFGWKPFSFARAVAQGAHFFISTPWKPTVEIALACGFARSKYVAGRVCCTVRTASAYRLAIRRENPVIHFRPGLICKEKPVTGEQLSRFNTLSVNICI